MSETKSSLAGTIVNGQAEHQYQIGHVIGSGGVGTVFRAQALHDGTTVALKLLHGERFPLSDAARVRMKQEIVIATEEIKSDYVVRGLDWGTLEKDDFLVMEWMGGGTLSNAIRTSDLSVARKIQWIAHLLKGFRDIHTAGYVHRDIKSNNVLISSQEVAKIADLGTAISPINKLHLTMPGDQIGSLLYISERQRHDPTSADASDDFYSLCVVFYELVSQRRFHTQNPLLEDLATDGFPTELVQLIDWGIAQRIQWSDVFNELCQLIDLASDAVDNSYSGSLLCPARMINQRVNEIVSAAAAKENGDPLDPSSTLDELLGYFESGWNEAVRRLRASGIHPRFVVSDWPDDAIIVNASPPPTIELLLDHFELAQIFYERGYGWITFVEEEDELFKVDQLGGKRLSIGDQHLPDDWESKTISLCDPDAKEWIAKLGYALAVEVALASLNYAADLIESAIDDAKE